MTKLKTPLLSLDAHGTLGNALTFQSSTKRKFAREKPKLPYSLTLPQAYQRWMYEDYCYLWRQQTVATKLEYRLAGTPYRLTAFQYWMKVMLTTMPDILAWWRLDTLIGAVAVDSGKKGNNGAVIGCLFQDGKVGHSYWWDGVNDSVIITNPPSMTTDLTDQLCIECWVKKTAPGSCFVITTQKAAAVRVWQIDIDATEHPVFRAYIAVGYRTVTSAEALTQDRWYHLLTVYNGVNLRIFLNGILRGTTPQVGDLRDELQNVNIGWWPGDGNTWRGNIDNLIVRNRAPDETEISRWAGRSYPSK